MYGVEMPYKLVGIYINNIKFRTMKNLLKKAHFALYILLPVFVFCVEHTQAQEQQLVKMLLQYETECYNDSIPIYERQLSSTFTLTEAKADSIKYKYLRPDNDIQIKINLRTSHIGNFDREMKLPDYEVWDVATFYTHKEPSFEDFLKWVRKKYCR